MSRQPWTDPVPDANLEGRWLLNEGAGSLLADASGNGETLAASSAPTWRAGYTQPTAMQFAGSRYGFLNDSAIRVNTDFTFATWVRTNLPDTTQTLFSVGDSVSTNNPRFALVINNFVEGAITYIGRTDANVLKATFNYGSGSIPTGKWAHVALVIDSAVATFYVNGRVVGTNSAPSADLSDITGTDDFCLGAQRYGRTAGTDLLDGEMQDARFYSRALAAREVQSIYKTGLVTVGQVEDFTEFLTGWWKFNEGTGITSEDFGSGGNTAEGVSATWVAGELAGPYCLRPGVGGLGVQTVGSDTLGITNTATLAAWINKDTIGDSGTIFQKHTNPSEQSWQFYVDDNDKLICRFYTDASNYLHFETAANAIDAEWHHVAAILNINTIQLYIDGVEITGLTDLSVGTFTTVEVNDAKPSIGAGSTGQLVGLIDDVRCYNAQLSEEKLHRVIRVTQPPFGPRNLVRGGGQ